jgi:hypothetical protein
VNKRLIIEAIFVVAAFLIGFVPEYVKAERLQGKVETLRNDKGQAELRDLAALAYVQANQKNYGLATETSSRLFDRLRVAADQANNPEMRKALSTILAMRDQTIAELAKGDPAAVTDLAQVYLKTRQATAVGGVS